MRCILPISTALALLGCSGDPLPTGPNVLLLTVDTLRADMTEPYGDAAPISPALQELAAGAVVFEEAWSGSSWTLPSLASLHTGLHSSVHGAWQFSDVLGWDFDTLAERLTAAGWDTAAVVNHVFLGRKHGLNQGFVHYDDELVEDFGKSHEAITSDTVSDRGIAWLEAKASADDGRPWFLWLHYFDPHEVYQRHDRYAPTFGDETDLERYRGEIAWTDEHLGRVLASLETLGLAEDTVVVLTADHGEEWEEHGGLGHGHTLYGELVRVPLVIRAPGVEPARIAERVSTLDVAPTVLKLTGVEPLSGTGGRSLGALLDGREGRRGPILTEVGRSEAKRMAAIGDGRWKLLWHEHDNEAELFDLETDPGEQRDVAALHPDEVERLFELLLATRKAAIETAPLLADETARASLGAAERQALADLGYVEDDEEEDQ